MTTFEIYTLFAIAVTLYTVILWLWGHLLEPYFTIVEVIIGTALCLLPAALDQRYNGPLTSEVYEWRVWVGFLIGAIPIGIWQGTKLVQSLRQAERDIRELNGHAPDRP